MRSINSVVINGNLGREGTLRETAQGGYVLEFSACVNTTKKTDDGWSDKANWVDCIMFGNRAESVSSLLDRGTNVTVQGHLDQSTWEKDGQRRSKLRVVVDEIRIERKPKEPQPGESSVYAGEDIPF